MTAQIITFIKNISIAINSLDQKAQNKDDFNERKSKKDSKRIKLAKGVKKKRLK